MFQMKKNTGNFSVKSGRKKVLTNQNVMQHNGFYGFSGGDTWRIYQYCFSAVWGLQSLALHCEIADETVGVATDTACLATR